MVDTLARSAALEMDLRMEASAISEMADNTRDDPGFVVPVVHWGQSARSVLTTNWIEAIPVRETARIDAAGLSRPDLARALVRGFLRHAIRDGFFHADMHRVICSPTPRTGRSWRSISAWAGSASAAALSGQILYGFIQRDYDHIAELHIEIDCALDPRHRRFRPGAARHRQPLVGRAADKISMAGCWGNCSM